MVEQGRKFGRKEGRSVPCASHWGTTSSTSRAKVIFIAPQCTAGQPGLTNPLPEATAAIRAATLRTINALNTALQIDNQWWPPEQAPRRAAGYLRRMVQLDYYDTNRTPDNDKVAAFARRWAGLVLTRRNDYVLKFD